MNASMVRLGGIAIFVMIVLSIVGAFIVAGSRVGSVVLNLINAALLLFALWTTKGYFNSQNYNRADLPIIIIIVAYALSTIIGVITGTAGGFGALQGGGGMKALGVIGIIVLIILLVALVAMLIFALRCLDFGKTGGGLWKAIGILYLIAIILFILLIVLLIIGAAAGAVGVMAAGGILGLISALVGLAGLICHGIGLIMGAGKMGAPA
jgi:hypothetical protein